MTGPAADEAIRTRLDLRAEFRSQLGGENVKCGGESEVLLETRKWLRGTVGGAERKDAFLELSGSPCNSGPMRCSRP